MNLFFARSSMRFSLEQFLVLSVAITPLVITARYYWGGLIFALTAVPLILLVAGYPDIRDRLKESWAHVTLTPAIVLSGLLAAWGLASVFLWSWTPHRSLHGFMKTSGCIIVAVVLAGVLKHIRRDRIFLPFVVATACGSLIGISTALSKGVVYTALGCCSDGGLQPVLSGCAVMTAIFVWPCIAWLSARRKPLAITALLAVALVVMSVCGNASAGVMLFAGLITYGLSYLFPRAVLLLPVLIVLVGFMSTPFMIDLFHYLQTLPVDTYIERFHGKERAVIWDYFDTLFWRQPWIGYGLRSEQIIGDPGRYRDLFPPPFASAHTHNTPLQILFDFGIVGGALTFAAISALTLRLLQHPHPERFRYGVISATAYLAGTLVNYGLWEWWLMTVMLLTVVLCRRLTQDDPYCSEGSF